MSHLSNIQKKIKNLNFISRDIKQISTTNPLSIPNDTDSKKRTIFTKKIPVKNGTLKLSCKTDSTQGQLGSVLLLNSRYKFIQKINPNGETILYNLKNGFYYIAMTTPPRSHTKISEIAAEGLEAESQITQQFINSKFKKKILLITPGYPSVGNEYAFAFVHSRMKAYKKHGIDVDLAVINQELIDKSESYEFEGVRVVCMGPNGLRNLLLERKYDKILVHFFLPHVAQVLDAVDTTNTHIFIFSHGADTLYWDQPYTSQRYFNQPSELTATQIQDFTERDEMLSRYNQKPNVTWVFVSDFTLQRSQELTGIKYRDPKIIPCIVDEEEFYLEKRKPEQRKKICVIRKFDDINSYSIDIVVRVILELSKRSFFEDLEFNIYGAGNMFHELTDPIKNIPNVKLHNTFLSHKKMAKMYRDNGVALFPTRYDNQAVASNEAAMTGAVVVTSDGERTGIKQFLDHSLGTFCPTEDFKAYADVIEKLYYDEELFLEISQAMHKFTFSAASFASSTKKDIELIKATKPPKLLRLNIGKPSQEPVLTIAIPAYNSEKFLTNSVLSLIDNHVAHKLEVLIINDGSKDRTAEVARGLEKLANKTGERPIVRLIDKPNGGHGSTINVGIQEATGRYFKLMDGDDYFSTNELVQLVEKLEEETADIVLTNYIEDLSIEGVKKTIRHYDFMTPGIHYDLDFMQYKGYGFDSWGPLLSTTTCRTQILKDANFKIDEHCFYVDMEYNFIIYALSKTVTYYPLDIYCYYLGRTGQSMSRESFTKNCLHHEKVTLRLLEEFYKRKDDLSEGKKQYLVDKIIIPMCKTQYTITTEYYDTSDMFLSFDSKLKQYKEFYNNREIAGRVIRLHRKAQGQSIRAHDTIKKTARLIKKR